MVLVFASICASSRSVELYISLISLALGWYHRHFSLQRDQHYYINEREARLVLAGRYTQ